METLNKNKSKKAQPFKVTEVKRGLFSDSPYLEKKHEGTAQFFENHGLPKEFIKK